MICPPCAVVADKLKYLRTVAIHEPSVCRDRNRPGCTCQHGYDQPDPRSER